MAFLASSIEMVDNEVLDGLPGLVNFGSVETLKVCFMHEQGPTEVLKPAEGGHG